MNKKAINLTWPELFEMLVLISVVVVVGFGIKGVYTRYFRESEIPEQPTNNFRTFATQTNSLKIENGEKIFPIKIGEDYEIKIYSKCPEGEQPSSFCSHKPKMCLNYIKEDKKKTPYCEYIEGSDFEDSITITANKYIKMKKEETDDGIITKIYT